MKKRSIRVLGEDYERYESGAPTALLTIKGTEKKIVNYLLERFSYGNDHEIDTLDEYIDSLNDGRTPQGDGCGIVLLIEDEKKKILFTFEDVHQTVNL